VGVWICKEAQGDEETVHRHTNTQTQNKVKSKQTQCERRLTKEQK